MKKLVKSRAEEQFAATQKKDNQARKKRDNVSQERAEHVASLKVLRLAKEAADKEAAEKAAAEKAAAKPEIICVLHLMLRPLGSEERRLLHKWNAIFIQSHALPDAFRAIARTSRCLIPWL